jgi:hypothetical protein
MLRSAELHKRVANGSDPVIAAVIIIIIVLGEDLPL